MIEKLEWDYKVPLTPFMGEQNDWNQTLVTKFNMAGTLQNISRNEYTLFVPIKFTKLIETLLYKFDFNIQYINHNNDDQIFVEKLPIKILNYNE